MTAPSPTWELVADIRARILAYDSAAFCPRPLGQAAASERRHKLVEILEVGPTSRIGRDTYADRSAIAVERSVFLQAFWAIGTTSAQLDAAEAEAGAWFDGLRAALVNYSGDQWSTVRHIRFVDEPVALGRDGGYLFSQLRIAAQIPISVGTAPVPPPP
jgi:hypothetical protein